MNWKEHVEKILKSNKHKVVTIDLEKATVSYTDKIKKHEDPRIIKGDEEIVRAYMIHRLINELDYKPEYIEIEKRYSIGRPKTSRAKIDVLVRDNKDGTFLFIELKAPDKFESDKELIEGQLFDLAHQEKDVKYLVYYTVDFKDNKCIDKAIIIDFEQFPNYHDWINAGAPSVGNELQGGYGKPKKPPYKKGDPQYALKKDLTPQELKSLATQLHNVLWGGGGTTDTEIFNSLVNLILAKIYDEDARKVEEEYEFQVKGYQDKKGNFETEQPETLFERINKLYRQALKYKLNIDDERKLEKIFVVNEEKFPLSKLVYTVQQLEGISLLEGRSAIDGKDILGDFFETITREGFRQTKGQFFTPINIVRFIIYALQIDNQAIQLINELNTLPYIIDPACGSGTFLIETMKIITKELKRKRFSEISSSNQVQRTFKRFFTPGEDENQWAKEFLYGIDQNFDLGTSSKVNMILHGDGSANIFVQDGLLPFNMYKKTAGGQNILIVQEPEEFYGNKYENGQFDVVISNPPFSVDLDNVTKQKVERSFLFYNKKNSENLFIERWYQLLKENGRLGVVLPESVFDTTENKYIRLFLFKYFKIKAVVSLPQLTFEPYTSTKTSLLFAQKKTKEEVKQWNELWEKYGKEWSELKTRVANYIKVFIDGEDQSKFPSIKDHKEKTIKENVLRFLKDFVNEPDKGLSVKELLEKYHSEIEEVSQIDNDIKDIFGYYNPWWVFGEVSRHVDYSIFMAEAETIGYKRTKRGEKPMPNNLFDVEIAPTFINKAAIIQGYDECIDHQTRLKTELDEELKIAEEKNREKPSEKLKRQIEQFVNDLEECKNEIIRLTKEKTEIEKIIDTYYREDGKRYRIKDEYYDRTDTTLLAHFTMGLLQQWRSDDVLLRKNTVVEILDAVRKEVVWE
ncbi:MAG: N-6 DNA methylase [Candidatus Brocadia sp.]|nr:N-6 DNA methylase [Candidatus Brocadia sp.]